MTDPIQYNHAYSALNHRKYIALKDKKSILTCLCQFKYETLPSIESYVAILKASNEKYWTEAYTAARLAELWVAFKLLPPSWARIPSLYQLKKQMDAVSRAIKKWRVDEDAGESKATRSSLNYQRLSGRVQDTIPFDPDKRDSLPCSACGHFSIMAVEEAGVTNEKNAALLAGFNEKMRRWSSLPESTRGGKPRKVSATSQLMGCYCYQMNSMLRSSGGNCINCRDAIKVGGSNLEQSEDGSWKSMCEVCACDCQVTYQRGDRFKIALNLEKEKRKAGLAEAPPEDSVSFFQSVISSTLVDASLEAGKEVASREEQGENALALASTSLLCNPHVQSNVSLRNNMQSIMKDRPRVTRGGKTISQIRAEYFNTATTTSTSSASSSSTVSCINKRFYNNKLCRSKSSLSSTKPIDLSSPSPPRNIPPPAPVTESASTPLLIKKTRVRINKRLWTERHTLGDEEKCSLKKAQQRLNKKDEELCTALLDTEPEFGLSIEAVDYCTNYVG